VLQGRRNQFVAVLNTISSCRCVNQRLDFPIRDVQRPVRRRLALERENHEFSSFFGSLSFSGSDRVPRGKELARFWRAGATF